jgi:hypothetical protein
LAPYVYRRTFIPATHREKRVYERQDRRVAIVVVDGEWKGAERSQVQEGSMTEVGKGDIEMSFLMGGGGEGGISIQSKEDGSLYKFHGFLL